MFLSNYTKLKSHKRRRAKNNLEQIIDFLKVIAEPNRLKILCVLQKEERCVCEIWQFLKLPQNLVSHHLKVLKDYKLVKRRKEGTKIFYSLNKKVIKRYVKLLDKILNQNYDN